MYFLKSRYYDPETGRFISPDAIEYADPETINGLNLYAYCGNNPVMNIDPEGHKWWHWVLGIFLVLSLAVTVAAVVGVAASILGASTVVTNGIMLGGTVGGIVSGGINLIGQAITGDGSVDFASLFIDTFVGATVGALTGGFAKLSPGSLTTTRLLVHRAFQVAANVITTTGGYIVSSALKGNEITFVGFGVSFLSGLVSGWLFNSAFIKSFIASVVVEIVGKIEDFLKQ